MITRIMTVLNARTGDKRHAGPRNVTILTPLSPKKYLFFQERHPQRHPLAMVRSGFLPGINTFSLFKFLTPGAVTSIYHN
jgi:hypothetical protein